MSLAAGTGPFGAYPRGTWNRELPDPHALLFLEDSPRWVRARLGGETVADSRAAKLLHRAGAHAAYWFPAADVRADLLEESGRTDEDPLCGPLRRHHVHGGGGRTAEHAAATCPDPPAEAAFLRGLVTLDFHAMDEWLEDDEPLMGHARDPYHRIDVRRTSRRVRVSAGGQTLAESAEASVLYETGLPPRWYFPREHVRMDLLERSDHRSVCAYKGEAAYFHAPGEENVAWTYEDPLHDGLPVRGLVAFFSERVELTVGDPPA